jgi:CHASE2 domain-containing sensor protein
MLRLLQSLPFRAGLTIVLGFIFALLSFHYGWFSTVDLKTYDLGLTVRPRTGSASKIVVIAIDRLSREACFSRPYFPISRHVNQHARVIRRLKTAGADVIAFDILFDQLDPTLNLATFDSALAEAQNVILAGAIESQLLKVTESGATFREERLLVPTPGISPSGYQLGLVNVPLGSDGVARRSYYEKEFQGESYPSLPLAAVSAFRETVPAQGRSDLGFFIDYSRPKAGFPTIPYMHVLNSEGWQKTVEGRIALIGVTENGLSDVHKSPVPGLPGSAQSGRLPGVLFLAYAANTLLEGCTITVFPDSLSLLFSLVLVAGCWLLLSGKRLGLSLALVAFCALVLFLGGIFLAGLSVTIVPAGKLVAVWLVAGTIGTIVNFSYTRLKSGEQESQLEEISSDLKMAQQIQQKLQPEKIPVMEEVDIAGLQIPCKEIGGDYYDVIQVSDRKVAVLVADVSGKGISGAMVMSNFQSVVHSLAPKVDSPGKLFAELNQAVAKIVTSGRFVTLFYGIFDRDTRRFTYANAGHTYPILCRAGGEVTELTEGGLFLGPFPQATWDDFEIQLETGDSLFIYTDGVTESAIQKTEEQFGEDRLKQFLAENASQKPDDMNRRLVDAVQNFTGSMHFDDDFTVLTLKIL